MVLLLFFASLCVNTMKNEDVNAYIEGLAGPGKEAFKKLWNVLRQEVPEAEEIICYGLPTLRLNKKNLIHAGAWKEHMALYPGAAAVAHFSGHPDCGNHSKGSIRFSYGQNGLLDVAIELLRYRIQELKKTGRVLKN